VNSKIQLVTAKQKLKNFCVILMKCVLQMVKNDVAMNELRLTLNCTKLLRTFYKNKLDISSVKFIMDLGNLIILRPVLSVVFLENKFSLFVYLYLPFSVIL
jgi:hypothetical protein